MCTWMNIVKKKMKNDLELYKKKKRERKGMGRIAKTNFNKGEKWTNN